MGFWLNFVLIKTSYFLVLSAFLGDISLQKSTFICIYDLIVNWQYVTWNVRSQRDWFQYHRRTRLLVGFILLATGSSSNSKYCLLNDDFTSNIIYRGFSLQGHIIFLLRLYILVLECDAVVSQNIVTYLEHLLLILEVPCSLASYSRHSLSLISLPLFHPQRFS